MRLDLLAAAAMTIVLAAPPAFAHGGHGPGTLPDEHMAPYMPYEDTFPGDYYSTARDAWIADCRHRLSLRYSRVGGTAIYNAEDASRTLDECEAYLADYYDRYARGGDYRGNSYGYPTEHGYAAPAVAYAYPAGGCCMGQPMIMVPAAITPECTETIEYVYEDVPIQPGPRKRHIPSRPSKLVPDKRVKIAP